VIGLVGTAHLISHFSQLLLAPLFPWLKEEFSVSYAELGFLMTIFLSCRARCRRCRALWSTNSARVPSCLAA
jgi:hypothetical protein